MHDASWGIEAGYESAGGEWRDADPATLAAIRAALGADGPGPLSARAVLDGDWIITLEDGAELDGHGPLPADLPLGYHRVLDDAGERLHVVAPPSCPVPAGRGWGWAVQLYGLRSARSWGIGDLGDLRALGEWSRAAGASMALVSPLHAPAPGLPQQPSPYYPGSRCSRNLLHLCVEDVPGAADAGVDLADLAAAGRALLGDRRIDRDAVYRLKRDALERIWARSWRRPAGADRRGGIPGWATYAAIAEVVGDADHRRWPAGLRRPDGADVARLLTEPAIAELVAFHAWIQWLLDEQVAAASEALPIMNDVAIGVDPGGADAWLWQDVFASGMRVGAPPDEFNTAGQDWGLPPFDPWRLRAADYEPFVQTVRAALRGARGLRVDHVMGLFRLWWIPESADPARGAYVRYPAADLLDILSLEAHRHGAAWVVGEDLGTVEDAVRDELSRRGVLSYRLLWFEDAPPAAWPEGALAAVTTHDLPTVAGLWSGAEPDAGPMRERLQRHAGLADGATVSEAVDGAHGALAAAPCALVTATLDDVMGVPDRPNHPGTTDEFPNWSLALPVLLEEVLDDPRTAATAAALGSRPNGGAPPLG
ncbi:MAG TPA: 4-alpha-glucanotransferase [Acidimicrobiales bacterium]|nr:4-alpha-glucanotransferase [Acidimicrobiales bacterium]